MTDASLNTLRACHIAIGTELTSGQTLNTNSRLIAGHLQEAGVKNQVHIVVPDDQALILQAFDFISPHSDWIFVYGGLGPTTDDFTRNVVSQWCEKNLELNETVWQHIQNILNGRDYPVREFQKQQALFPEGAHIMENTKGTAHGFHVSAKGKEIFVVPGPPKEVQSVLENYLIPWIQKHSASSNSQITEIWNTLGLGESEVAFQIENLIKDYNITAGYRVHLPYVEVKISYLKSQEEANKSLVKKITDTLKPILVYKNQYPYPEYFKTYFSAYTSFVLIDEVTQGGTLADMKSWIPQWENRQMTYSNLTTGLSFPVDEKTLRLTVRKTGDAKIKITLKTNVNDIEFEISTENIFKMPDERKPFYLKEVIYRELTKRIDSKL